MEDLQIGRAVSRRYRNRHIGEFLKELDLTEGRSTGIPKILRVMNANGSPPPIFETDEDRSYFLIRLPVHDKFTSDVALIRQVTEQVIRLLEVVAKEPLKTKALMQALLLNHRPTFIQNY